MQTGMPAFTGNLGTLAGVYRTPASHIDVTAVFTHTQPVRPYRGNGRPEAGYIIERMVDLAADQIGMDPAELRKRNTIPASAMPFKTSVTFTYDCGEFEKNLDLALQAADKKGFEKRRAEAKKHGKLRGFGFSNTIERSAAAGLEGAEIRFDRTGSVSIFSGSINQGQGHETAFKQVVCDRLGLDPQGSHLHPGRHRPGVLRRRHRRLALGGVFRLGLHSGGREGRGQGQGDRREDAESRSRRHQFP